LALSSAFVPIPENDLRLEPFRDEKKSYIALADSSDDKPTEAWRNDFPSAWIVVALRYRSSIVGLAILAKSRAPKNLDWEDENLIRIVGLQLGAYLVQEETAQSLADARQLEEFNKRFAFIVHDIKNTIGQLSLLVRNAAQYGHEPEFRADMITTLVVLARPFVVMSGVPSWVRSHLFFAQVHTALAAGHDIRTLWAVLAAGSIVP